ncbi:fluoride efflux transporter FluC [Microbacterium sp. GXF7504]
MAGPPAFSWTHLGLVAAGGAIGTALRAAVTLIETPAIPGLVVAIVNLIGAFGLGVVTGAVVRRGDGPRTRAMRQFLGTGLLGGFTTYSAFALDAVTGTPVWLTLGTAVLGVGAAWFGLVLVRPAAPRRGGRA